jgi:hypothetical protein
MATIHVNLFGGPGTGKSTTATGVFNKLKKKGAKVEYCSEYAKELTYRGETHKLGDQLYLLAKQHQKLLYLEGKVDIVIHDGPLLLNKVYAELNYVERYRNLYALTEDIVNSYTNINIYLIRDKNIHPYQSYGRGQSESEAEDLDVKILKMLWETKGGFNVVPMSDNTEDDIIDIIEEVQNGR